MKLYLQRPRLTVTPWSNCSLALFRPAAGVCRSALPGGGGRRRLRVAHRPPMADGNMHDHPRRQNSPRPARRLRRDRQTPTLLRRILQQSYYLAAVKLLDAPPAWGALSGVRPTKLTTQHILAGGDRRSADRLLRDTFYVSPARRALCLDASAASVEAAGLPGADGSFCLYRHPILPVALHLLQLRQPIRRALFPAAGAVSGCADPGDPIYRQAAGAIRPTASAPSIWAAAHRRPSPPPKWAA